MRKILLALLAGLLSVFAAVAAACAAEDEPQTIETNVTASTVRDDMTISVAAQAESFDGMQCTLYYGETQIESVAAASNIASNFFMRPSFMFCVNYAR